VCFVVEESKSRRLVPGEGNTEPCGERGCLGSACWSILSALRCESTEDGVPTLSMAIVEEDLWSFCCILWNPNDVAISAAGAAA
jgi:hypothetical protein